MSDRVTSSASHWERVFAPFAKDVAAALQLNWGVWDQAAGAWLFRSAESSSVDMEGGFPSSGWLVQHDGSWHHIEERPVSEMVTDVAETVQTAVMDELGHGWPEFSVRGVFRGLLKPRVESDEVPEIVWRHGDVTCRAGDLADWLDAVGEVR